jgi:hypothetical protein
MAIDIVELEPKDYEGLLLLIEDDKNFVKLQIFLLEKQGNYLSSFRLNMYSEELKLQIFDWIDDKLEKLSENTIDEDVRFGQLKNLVAKHMREII